MRARAPYLFEEARNEGGNQHAMSMHRGLVLRTCSKRRAMREAISMQ